jgi:two-component system phosphate regulon response regulator PhoB
MTKISILLTDPIVASLQGLVHDDLVVEFAPLGSTAPDRLFDGSIWAFVDWLLPDLSGLELCRRLRASPQTEGAHITMVLEEDDPEARRRALRAGADDYMVGPLDRTRLLDRIMSLSPGELHAAPPGNVIRHGDLAIDSGTLQVSYRGRRIALMPNEFRLLRFFAEHPGRIFTRSQLIAGLGKQEPTIDERTVDVWVGRLRRALLAGGAGNPLRTVRSMGYILDPA